MIEKKPFYRYSLEEAKDKPLAVKRNKEDLAKIEEIKRRLQQPKDSTALKQCAWIGLEVLRNPLLSSILGIVFNNKRKNKRLGIPEDWET
jgi:hypothetical protein